MSAFERLQRWLGRAPSNPTEVREFVDLAYRHVLQREADDEGLSSYLERLQEGSLSHAGVLREMVSSAEFEARQNADPAHASEEMSRYRRERDRDLESALKTCNALNRDVFLRIWEEVFGSERELVIGQHEYAPQHKRRFWELFNAVDLLIRDVEDPRLLEFGVSEYSGFYRRLWPQLTLEVADRPTGAGYPGFTEATSLRVSGARAFHAVDLNLPRTLFTERYQDLRERFNVVVFAEVLEHLIANPVEILEQLLVLLRPGGAVYLTTPNFFRRENLQRIEARCNPQEVYPAGEENWDAHHHHREYAAREMLRFIEEAGGWCRAFYYSDCWDEDTDGLTHEAARGNMVFVITRRRR